MFSVATVAYEWADVALAAALWSDWSALEHQVAEGLAWCTSASEAGPPVDSEAVRARAQRFRQRRRLLAADDMQAWLERWEVSASAWTDYLRRAEARQRHGSAKAPAPHPPDDEVLAAAMHTEAVCSGRLEAWAQQLAGRAAVHAVAPEEPITGPTAFPADLSPTGLPPLRAQVLQPRNRHLLSLEASWVAFEASVMTAEAIEAEVRARQLDWIRFDCQSVTVAGEDAAREVALTLRRNERPLDAVARDAGVTVEHRSFRLDAASPDLAVALVGAQPGDLLRPLRGDGGFIVIQVLRKISPSAGDPDIRDEAARRVRDRAVQHLVNERVVWHEHL